MDKLASLVLSVILVGVGSAVSHQATPMDFCEFSADRSAAIPSAGATKLVIAAGAGDLVVRGDDAAREVSANGRVCASSRTLLEQAQVKIRREGNTVYLSTVLPESGSGFPWLDNATLDLTVSLPASLAVELEDSSGDLHMSSVRSVTIQDSSGDIEASDIAGDVSVSDGSGDMRIERVAGKVEIVQDSSGDIGIEDVARNVDVLLDSSGEMQIERVGGSVRIRQDSSGDIVIREVKRNAIVDSDSSGDIRVVQVDGDFTVHGDSTGNISHDRIEGKVKLPPDRDRDEY
jgi:hypothetical protein